MCQSLPLDCLVSVFSLLQDEDLIRASTVCKEWYDAAETPWLWRRMCLQRWSFCNVSQLLSDAGTHSWKAYYLRRSHLEMKMKTGRSCADYTCKSLRGHKGKGPHPQELSKHSVCDCSGRVVGVVYLAGNDGCADVWKQTPVVCSASTDGTVKAWDIHKVGTVLGSLVVLTCPALSEVSRHVVCDSFSLNLLRSSPDRKWILAASRENLDLRPKVRRMLPNLISVHFIVGTDVKQHSSRSAKMLTHPCITILSWCVSGEVFYSESVCLAAEDEERLSQSLPVAGCCAAVFLPSQPARLALIHSDGRFNNNTLSVFDLTLKESKYKKETQAQQVASFQVALSHRSDVILEARGSSTLLVTDGNHLKVYTIKGELITSFEDHSQPITALCVDSFRVVTASRDLSLRILTWRSDPVHGHTLQSQYQLLGGSITRSRGFTNVACDHSSIVGSVESVDGNDVLKAYTFDF
ncbi:hypothetical protein cypCar_00026859 [Cyprinus carpio]|nr:hypothetical protein cypCar_00026859 [Cyprinus carpio]